MPSNAGDESRVYVTPALQSGGSREPVWRIAEQHCFTEGRIALAGDNHCRQKGTKAEHRLRHCNSFPTAAVEDEDLVESSGRNT